ncbi:glutathione S-transferase family protein [Pseudooceanicola nitratireducens]|uniref:glutathione S-transferase family protein n=1 Tax=Pseudooceanicola nitratireducens TaxID=517719 RepID=UPI0023F14814|nr:glutathione S-transferase family protein [Pseudooceanicola nitratireducens]
MGQLIDGTWEAENLAALSSGGEFKRKESSYRSWITADGSAGPSGEAGFKAESGRYHLYVSYACPWAHRTLIFRQLKDLADHITVSVVHPDMLDKGWSFDSDFPEATGDDLLGKSHLHEVYTQADPTATTRVTVPVLWDKSTGQIVSNESAEIIRMFNSAFNGLTGNTTDYYPEALQDRIDEINDRIYDTVNNGVYKSGFASSQKAYDKAVTALFNSLDWIEGILAENRYLTGDTLTEADWRLFTTLIRFDKVYHTHFKCNRSRILDFPNMWGYLKELYQMPGVAETVNFDHITRHYYYSHDHINPNRIVPITPDLDLISPHGRG